MGYSIYDLFSDFLSVYRRKIKSAGRDWDSPDLVVDSFKEVLGDYRSDYKYHQLISYLLTEISGDPLNIICKRLIEQNIEESECVIIQRDPEGLSLIGDIPEGVVITLTRNKEQGG